MIKSVYSKYFQKSKSFLYPALGIRKNSKFPPSGTYLSIQNYIEPEEAKLICTFEKNESDEFKLFELNNLIENPLFLEKIEVEDYYIYIFDYNIYQDDWFSFILGRYSKFSSVLKRAIKQYYGINSAEYAYMDTYLNPEDYFEQYAKLLDVNQEDLEEAGELCNPCDLEKETLKIPKEYLEKLKKEN